MTTQPIRKTFAIFSAAVYLAANAVFLHAAENNLWAERKKTVGRTEMAALPAAGAGSARVLNGLPSVSASLALLSPAVVEKVPAGLPAPVSESLKALLNAVPARHGSVRRIYAGRKADPKAPVIFHIQDVHAHLEAQKNIAGALAAAAVLPNAALISLEGAAGPISLDKYRRLSDRRAVKQTADWLLKENEISGPVHALLTLPDAAFPPAVGVDDDALHEANVEAYRRSTGAVPAVKRRLGILRKENERSKARSFNPALHAFDLAVQSHRADKTPLGDYVEALAARAPATPQAARFLEALSLEKSLDFQRVEAERSALIEALVRKMDKAAMDALLERSVAYRAGLARHADFYEYLNGLCGSRGVPLSGFPAMDSYLRYVLAADRIDASVLLEELDAMEAAAYARLAETSAEKALLARSRAIHLAGKLAGFSLTPAEWREYSEAGQPLPGLEGKLSTFEDFYRSARARDEAMTENLFKRLNASSSTSRAPLTILVTGGFHAEGMSRLLRERGAVVVEFVPAITKIDAAAGSAYLSVFSREKSPLELLFKGDRTFVFKHPAAGFAKAPTGRFALATRLGIASAPDVLEEDERISGKSADGKADAIISSGGKKVRVRMEWSDDAISRVRFAAALTAIGLLTSVAVAGEVYGVWSLGGVLAPLFAGAPKLSQEAVRLTMLVVTAVAAILLTPAAASTFSRAKVAAAYMLLLQAFGCGPHVPQIVRNPYSYPRNMGKFESVTNDDRLVQDYDLFSLQEVIEEIPDANPVWWVAGAMSLFLEYGRHLEEHRALFFRYDPSYDYALEWMGTTRESPRYAMLQIMAELLEKDLWEDARRILSDRILTVGGPKELQDFERILAVLKTALERSKSPDRNRRQNDAYKKDLRGILGVPTAPSLAEFELDDAALAGIEPWRTELLERKLLREGGFFQVEERMKNGQSPMGWTISLLTGATSRREPGSKWKSLLEHMKDDGTAFTGSSSWNDNLNRILALAKRGQIQRLAGALKPWVNHRKVVHQGIQVVDFTPMDEIFLRNVADLDRIAREVLSAPGEGRPATDVPPADTPAAPGPTSSTSGPSINSRQAGFTLLELPIAVSTLISAVFLGLYGMKLQTLAESGPIGAISAAILAAKLLGGIIALGPTLAALYALLRGITTSARRRSTGAVASAALLLALGSLPAQAQDENENDNGVELESLGLLKMADPADEAAQAMIRQREELERAFSQAATAESFSSLAEKHPLEAARFIMDVYGVGTPSPVLTPELAQQVLVKTAASAPNLTFGALYEVSHKGHALDVSVVDKVVETVRATNPKELVDGMGPYVYKSRPYAEETYLQGTDALIEKSPGRAVAFLAAGEREIPDLKGRIRRAVDNALSDPKESKRIISVARKIQRHFSEAEFQQVIEKVALDDMTICEKTGVSRLPIGKLSAHRELAEPIKSILMKSQDPMIRRLMDDFDGDVFELIEALKEEDMELEAPQPWLSLEKADEWGAARRGKAGVRAKDAGLSSSEEGAAGSAKTGRKSSSTGVLAATGALLGLLLAGIAGALRSAANRRKADALKKPDGRNRSGVDPRQGGFTLPGLLVAIAALGSAVFLGLIGIKLHALAQTGAIGAINSAVLAARLLGGIAALGATLAGLYVLLRGLVIFMRFPTGLRKGFGTTALLLVLACARAAGLPVEHPMTVLDEPSAKFKVTYNFLLKARQDALFGAIKELEKQGHHPMWALEVLYAEKSGWKYIFDPSDKFNATGANMDWVWHFMYLFPKGEDKVMRDRLLPIVKLYAPWAAAVFSEEMDLLHDAYEKIMETYPVPTLESGKALVEYTKSVDAQDFPALKLILDTLETGALHPRHLGGLTPGEALEILADYWPPTFNDYVEQHRKESKNPAQVARVAGALQRKIEEILTTPRKAPIAAGVESASAAASEAASEPPVASVDDSSPGPARDEVIPLGWRGTEKAVDVRGPGKTEVVARTAFPQGRLMDMTGRRTRVVISVPTVWLLGGVKDPFISGVQIRSEAWKLTIGKATSLSMESSTQQDPHHLDRTIITYINRFEGKDEASVGAQMLDPSAVFAIELTVSTPAGRKGASLIGEIRFLEAVVEPDPLSAEGPAAPAPGSSLDRPSAPTSASAGRTKAANALAAVKPVPAQRSPESRTGKSGFISTLLLAGIGWLGSSQFTDAQTSDMGLLQPVQDAAVSVPFLEWIAAAYTLYLLARWLAPFVRRGIVKAGEFLSRLRSPAGLQATARVLVAAALSGAAPAAGQDSAASTRGKMEEAGLSIGVRNGFTRLLARAPLDDHRLVALVRSEIEARQSAERMGGAGDVRRGYHRAAIDLEGGDAVKEFAAGMEKKGAGIVVVTRENLQESRALAAWAAAGEKPVVFAVDPAIFPKGAGLSEGKNAVVVSAPGAVLDAGTEGVQVVMAPVIAAVPKGVLDRMRALGFSLALPAGAAVDWRGVEEDLLKKYVIVIINSMKAKRFTMEEFDAMDRWADVVAAMA